VSRAARQRARELVEETTGETDQIAVRMPRALVERLDARASQMSRETKVLITRAAVVRMLLEEGLSAPEGRRGRLP
jgi:predicted DNA-binding protein